MKGGARTDEALDPPRSCCGREFTLRRAFASHVSNHKRCAHCNEFEGCTAALKAHEWTAHGIGKRPLTQSVTAAATGAEGEGYARRDGNAFKLLEEAEEEPESIEQRFPGAEIMWSLEGRTGATASNNDDGCNDDDALPPLAWPAEECRVLLILGRSGSGKSRVLRALAAGAGVDAAVAAAAATWPNDRSILDGIGGEDAASWLGAVGLNSVPLWCQPHAALSTGEGFRAELARRLKLAAAAGTPLVVDAFCDHLDPLSAACTSASLARHLRSESGRATRAILASCHDGIAPFLRPDAVILCRGGSAPPVLFRNDLRAAPLPLQIGVLSEAPVGGVQGSSSSSSGSGGGGELFLRALRRCGLHIRCEKSFDDAPPFQHDILASARPQGGTVLAAKVETTAATRACDTFFDLPHDGTCAKRIVPFPSRDELLRGIPTSRPWLGLICGSSGASKSALLAIHFGAPPNTREWPAGRLEEGFASAEQAERCLRAAGLPQGCLHSWRRERCSSGELAQVRLALTLAAAEQSSSLALFDEFGSAWDDETARHIGAALTAALDDLRCEGVVLVSCHPSLVGRSKLAPDWIYEAASATCLWVGPPPSDSGEAEAAGAAAVGDANDSEASPLLRRLAEAADRAAANDDSTETQRLADGGTASIAPAHFELTMRLCEPSAWVRFHQYHYKTPQLSTVATTFLLEATLHGCVVPAGFVATIPHSGKKGEGASAPPQRAHRTVVLPEWQGFGVGGRMSDAVGEWHRRRGSEYHGQTVHPRFGGARDASPLWEATPMNHTTPQLRWLPRRLTGAGHQDGNSVAVKRRHLKMVYAHQYVGAQEGDEATRRYLEGRVRFL